MKNIVILLVVLVVILAVGITLKASSDAYNVEQEAERVYFGEIKATGLVGVNIESKAAEVTS